MQALQCPEPGLDSAAAKAPDTRTSRFGERVNRERAGAVRALRILVVGTALAGRTMAAHAETSEVAAAVDFNRDVRPILS